MSTIDLRSDIESYGLPSGLWRAVWGSMLPSSECALRDARPPGAMTLVNKRHLLELFSHDAFMGQAGQVGGSD
jgi:hypothetical protein